MEMAMRCNFAARFCDLRFMKLFPLIFSLLVLRAGAAPITSFEGSWTDAGRSREIPYKVYAPASPSGLCPVVIFSHGLGGSREGYRYLGSFWASNGYVVIHVQHAGSDDAVWRNAGGPSNVMRAMNASAMSLQNAIDRPQDVSFAIGRLAELATNAVLRGHIDTNRIGVAGHSFGAYTTMAVAGQGVANRGGLFRDPRVKAAIAMSMPTPRPVSDAMMADVKIPTMHLTGTKDTSPVGRPQKAEDRRGPFDHIRGVDEYLVIFNGGDHMLFSGQRIRGEHDLPDDPRNHHLIQTGTLAFWDAYLRDDAKAKAWLQGGGFERELGDAAVLETKSGGEKSSAAGANGLPAPMPAR
jgi:predicted dienelactone hydrolase